MPTYVRVKDKQTGHEFSLPEGSFDRNDVTVLDKEAVNAGGDPLPTKHKTTASSEAAKKSGNQAADSKE